MKRWIAIALTALLLFTGCGAKEQAADGGKPASAQSGQNEANEMKSQSNQTVTFVNGLQEADVWILPETPENQKTTVWGTATLAKVKTGERREAPLSAPGDEGLYMLRMIDTEHFYYSAGGITLQAGWTMEVKGADLHSVTLEVTDEAGVLQRSYEVFAARL